MTGRTLAELGFTAEIVPPYFSVKESVFPFVRFPGAPIVLTPEMRSTGEVMGIDEDLGLAYAKAQMGAWSPLPRSGNVFMSVKDADKPLAVELGRRLVAAGFTLFSTGGTAEALRAGGVEAKPVFRIAEGRPHAVDLIKNGEIQFLINTPRGQMPRQDENIMRAAALKHGVAVATTMTGARAAVDAIEAMARKPLGVRSLQEYAKLRG
jgi:carbamoyl-phosphate synthase large subunit